MARPVSSADSAKIFVKSQLFDPILTKALATLCQEKPENPVKWLAEYLIANNPNTPKLVDAGNAQTASLGQTVSASSGSGRSLPAAGEEAAVVDGRTGKVLNKDTLLVSDLNEAALSASIKQSVDGAPNFRKVDDFAVFACGQPTREGAIGAINQAYSQCQSDALPLHWINVREDPCVYVDGKPFCVRSRGSLEETIWSSDLMANDIESLEAELKTDVCNEIIANSGKVLIHEHSASPICYWQQTSVDRVQTSAEFFADAQAKFPKLVYRSIPVADDHSFTAKDIDMLVGTLKDVTPDAPRVLSCAMGLGRASTASCIAVSLLRQVNKAGPLAPPPTPVSGSMQEEYAAGRYAAIKHFVAQAGDDSAAVLSSLENTVDRCGAVVNVRKVIFENHRRLAASLKDGAMASAKAKMRLLWSLDRWASLLCVAQYIHDSVASDWSASYEEWIKGKAEVVEQMSKLGEQ